MAWDLHDTWSSPNYTVGQKVAGSGIAVASTAAGIGVGVLATAALNIWNPVGWGAFLGIAAFAGVTVLGNMFINGLKDNLYEAVGMS